MDPVQYQYNRYPYPDYPLLARPDFRNLENIRYSPMALRAGFEPVDEKKVKILLMGCGTAEPLTFATAHPKSSILAVDVSESSIKRAQQRLLTRLKFNVEFRRQNLLELTGQFHLISAYGVLHHLQDPLLGFQKIQKLLAPDGIARVMVYSKVSRLRWTQLSQFFKAFGLHASTPDLTEKIYDLVSILPVDHPLKSAFFLNSERKSLAGIVDCFFHAQERFFMLSELLATLDRSDLQIFHWQNHPTDSLESLFLKEAVDELEGNFVFWVKKKRTDQPITQFSMTESHASKTPPLPMSPNPLQEQFCRLHWPSFYLNAELLKKLPLPLQASWRDLIRIPHISREHRRDWQKQDLPTDGTFGAVALDRENQISEALNILSSRGTPPLFDPSMVPLSGHRLAGEDLEQIETWITAKRLTWVGQKWSEMTPLNKIEVLDALFSPQKPFSEVHFKAL